MIRSDRGERLLAACLILLGTLMVVEAYYTNQQINDQHACLLVHQQRQTLRNVQQTDATATVLRDLYVLHPADDPLPYILRYERTVARINRARAADTVDCVNP